MGKYGRVLSKLENMKSYIFLVETQNYTSCTRGDSVDEDIQPNSESSPQMCRTYARGLCMALSHATAEVNEIERELKKSQIVIVEGSEKRSPRTQPCTTLTQLDLKLQTCLQTIEILYSLHDQSTGCSEDESNWFKSVKLISCLEAHLSQEGRPEIYGLVMYLFSKCLNCFLQELLQLLETAEWENEDFLFQKNHESKLDDPDFWEKIITVQPIAEKLKEINIEPLSCFKTVLPKFLIVLKVLEMIRQLNEDYTLVLAGELPTKEKIINEFVHEILPWIKTQDTKVEEISFMAEPEPDYETHFMFLGLQNSLVAAAFQCILDESKTKLQPEQEPNNGSELENFTEVRDIPVKATNDCLQKVMSHSLEPYFSASRRAFKKLFEDYEVEKTMKLFREIIFGGREDFAIAVIQLSGKPEVDPKYVRFNLKLIK
jgi:hypothetical protein